jgi:hypothetical protein
MAKHIKTKRKRLNQKSETNALAAQKINISMGVHLEKKKKKKKETLVVILKWLGAKMK